jgi:hypothetical protein
MNDSLSIEPKEPKKPDIILEEIQRIQLRRSATSRNLPPWQIDIDSEFLNL